MSCLLYCGLCCSCLSVWAIIQLSLMGVFYWIETPILIEDVEEHHATNFEDYIDKTRMNYWSNAVNCWATAAIYLVTLILSIICIVVSNKKEAKKQKLMEDDELACITVMPKEPELVAAPVDKKKKTPPKSEVKSPEARREARRTSRGTPTSARGTPTSARGTPTSGKGTPASGRSARRRS